MTARRGIATVVAATTVAPEDGVVVLEVPGIQPGEDRFCRGAALVITHVDPNSDDDSDEFTVAARGVADD
jgi:hypothetical protein